VAILQVRRHKPVEQLDSDGGVLDDRFILEISSIVKLCIFKHRPP
jgi:hypothetical protein